MTGPILHYAQSAGSGAHLIRTGEIWTLR